MFYAIYVGLEGFVHRRIEVDDTCKIHDDIDLALELFSVIRRNAAQWLVEIAFDDLHLLADNTFATHAFENCLQRRRLQHFRIEALLTGNIFLPPHLDDQVLQLREAIENHRQQHFSNKAGAAEKKDRDRKSTRLNSSHVAISYAVCC